MSIRHCGVIPLVGSPIPPQGSPSEGPSLTADPLWNSELYHLQVRELERQLGQTRSQSIETASDELPAHPDPRKLSAQEKNLLRIRNLEREKQEGWEVTHALKEVGVCRARRPCPLLRGLGGSPCCQQTQEVWVISVHVPHILSIYPELPDWFLTGSSPRAHFMNIQWPRSGCFRDVGPETSPWWLRHFSLNPRLGTVH